MFALARRNLIDSFIDDAWSEFDSLFTRSWVWPRSSFGNLATAMPEAEAYTHEGNLVYRFAVPGVDPKDVDISVVNNQLSIKVERREPANTKGADWHRQSFSYGKFEQTVRLPNGVDPDAVQATFKHGVLEVSVPLPKAIQPKRIEVKELAEVNA